MLSRRARSVSMRSRSSALSVLPSEKERAGEDLLLRRVARRERGVGDEPRVDDEHARPRRGAAPARAARSGGGRRRSGTRRRCARRGRGSESPPTRARGARVMRRGARLDGRIVAPRRELAVAALHEDHGATALDVRRRDGERVEVARASRFSSMRSNGIERSTTRLDARRVEEAALARGHVAGERRPSRRREHAAARRCARARRGRASSTRRRMRRTARSPVVRPRGEPARVERADRRAAEDVEAEVAPERRRDLVEHVLHDADLVRAARGAAREHEGDALLQLQRISVPATLQVALARCVAAMTWLRQRRSCLPSHRARGFVIVAARVADLRDGAVALRDAAADVAAARAAALGVLHHERRPCTGAARACRRRTPPSPRSRTASRCRRPSRRRRPFASATCNPSALGTCRRASSACRCSCTTLTLSGPHS